MLDQRIAAIALFAGLAHVAPASAMPWNLDMVDSETVKAYERVMKPLPEGVMSQPNLLTPIAWRKNYAFGEADSIVNPYAGTHDERLLALGGKMYHTYCTPCHGDGVNLGLVSTVGKYPAVAVLAGESGRLQNQTDGHVYWTIRNGSVSTLMPSYAYAMTEKEMWATIQWMRENLPNARHEAPAPAAEQAEGGQQ